MKRLAVETLLEIFHHYLHLQDIRTWTKPTVCHSRHTFTSPILLTHVCRLWRDIACNDPKLWSSIFVIGPTLNQIPLVKLWLSRTKNFTLRIEFLERHCQSFSKELTVASLELLKVFWEKKRFWAIIDFEFTNILDEHSNWMPGEVAADPELEVYSARIIDNRQGHKYLTLPLWQTVPWCPRLQRLEVGPLFFPTVNANLRELICHGPQTHARILRLLAGCPRLEKFEGTVTGHPFEENPWEKYPKGALIHSELRHLCLNSFCNVTSLAIYNALTCPRLEFLSAELNGGNLACSQGMSDLIERSKCRLRTLKGVNVEFWCRDIDNVIHFFSHPELQDLETLLVLQPDENFFQAITLPSSASDPSDNFSPPSSPSSAFDPSDNFSSCSNSDSDSSYSLDPPSLFPRLKNLDIVFYEADTGAKFSQMLVSRFEHLRRVRLSGTPPDTILLEGHRVWDFPGIVMGVTHDFCKRDILWNDYALFGGAWDQNFVDEPMVQAQPYVNKFFRNKLGRGDEWYGTDRFYVLIDGRSHEGSPQRKGDFRLSDDA